MSVILAVKTNEVSGIYQNGGCSTLSGFIALCVLGIHNLNAIGWNVHLIKNWSLSTFLPHLHKHVKHIQYKTSQAITCLCHYATIQRLLI